MGPEEIGPEIPIFFGAAGGGPATSTIVTLNVPVRPPKVAVTVTGWFDVTAAAVRTPPEVIVAYVEFSLHVGVIAVVVPLSHVPVAVYVPVAPSFTDDGPLTVTLVSTAAASRIVMLIVPVRPPKVAVTVTVWFDVTAEAVRTPPEVIVAYVEFSLHVGLIAAVVPLSHVPVAVYVPVAPSFTDDGPLTVTLVSTAGTSTIVMLIVPVRRRRSPSRSQSGSTSPRRP